MRIYTSDIHQIKAAAEALRAGGLIAFPTETVYGLGADASQPEAVARIFAAKGRPADHPLILHVGSVWEVEPWVASMPPAVARLGARFWPGPLTLVLPRSERVPDAVTGGQPTVAVRVPDHPVALALLHAFGGALAAPSANPYGKISPTTAAHVADQLGDVIDGVIDGGACKVGIESTILDLTRSRARVLRQGMITPAMLAESLGYLPEAPVRAEARIPGSDLSHYAPEAWTLLVESDHLTGLIDHLRGDGFKVAVLSYMLRSQQEAGLDVCQMPANPYAYARVLYAMLRELDQARPDVILIETPPEGEAWNAIADRLRRASHDAAVSGWGNLPAYAGIFSADGCSTGKP